MKKHFRNFLILVVCVAMCFSLSITASANEVETQEEMYTYEFTITDGKIQPRASYLGGVVIDYPKTSGSMEVQAKADVLGITLMPLDWEEEGAVDKNRTASVFFQNNLSKCYGTVNNSQNIPIDGKYHEGNFNQGLSYLTKGTWTVTVTSTTKLLFANIAVGS